MRAVRHQYGHLSEKLGTTGGTVSLWFGREEGAAFSGSLGASPWGLWPCFSPPCPRRPTRVTGGPTLRWLPGLEKQRHCPRPTQHGTNVAAVGDPQPEDGEPAGTTTTLTSTNMLQWGTRLFSRGNVVPSEWERPGCQYSPPAEHGENVGASGRGWNLSLHDHILTAWYIPPYATEIGPEIRLVDKIR